MVEWLKNGLGIESLRVRSLARLTHRTKTQTKQTEVEEEGEGDYILIATLLQLELLRH